MKKISMKKISIILAVIISIPLIVVLIGFGAYISSSLIGAIIAAIFWVVSEEDSDTTEELILYRFASISALITGIYINIVAIGVFISIGNFIFMSIEHIIRFFTAQ